MFLRPTLQKRLRPILVLAVLGLVLGVAAPAVALTVVDDGANGSARVTLGALSGTNSGAGTLAGNLGLAAVPTITSGTTTDSPFNQISNAMLSGIGTGAGQSITLNFSWTASAGSTRSGNNGDEAAVRMGLTSSALNFTADDYAGIGGRAIAGDGQFVSAMLVPDPASFVLLAGGLTGLAIHGRGTTRGSAPIAARAA